MRNLIIAFLFMPILCSAQFKIGQCHTDLVFGFDIGDRIGLDKNADPDKTYSYLKTFRMGTNIAYPVSRKWLLVSGIRFASRLSKETEISPQISRFPDRLQERKFSSFFVEVPFNFRRTLSRNRKGDGYFLEGGLQFNVYVLSYRQEKITILDATREVETDEILKVDNDLRSFSISNNMAIGWENTLRNGYKYFIQMVGRVELIAANQDNKNAYHLGIETGFRF